jgi:hypothetical protein
MLRIYRITSVVLLAVLALMPLIYRRNIIFATFATTAIMLVLILIAFQTQIAGSASGHQTRALTD